MEKNNTKSKDKIRMVAILIVSLLVIITGAFFIIGAVKREDIAGAIPGGFIAIIILIFAISVYIRGNKDLKRGLPLKDERSRKVVEKASLKAFLVSIYLLLAIGILSEEVITFRDVSQATGITVGIMAVLFAVFWIYYNRKGDV